MEVYARVCLRVREKGTRAKKSVCDKCEWILEREEKTHVHLGFYFSGPGHQPRTNTDYTLNIFIRFQGAEKPQ